MYKLILLIGLLTSSLYSQQTKTVELPNYSNSIISTDSSFSKETTEKRIENYWGFHLGYCPDMNDEVYASHGFGVMLNMDNYSGSSFNWGWYFIFRNTFKDSKESQKTGSASLGASLSYHFSSSQNSLLIKIGFGLRTSNYVHISTPLSIEYQFPINKDLLLSISIIEEIIHFRGFAPPLISVGIIF